MIGTYTVSYTHLDVYKRQGHHRSDKRFTELKLRFPVDIARLRKGHKGEQGASVSSGSLLRTPWILEVFLKFL